MRHVLAGLACAALFASAQARADATVVFLRGEAREGGERIAQGRHILPGGTLTTGRGAQAYLRFSDGQKIVLDQDTAFRIVEFHYSAHLPQSDRASFELLRGAVRFVSGAIGGRNPGVVALRTPQATLSLRGTDFIVALPSWAYLKVLKGGVGVTNAGGTVIFGADTAAIVSSDSAIARPIFAASLPPAASGPIARLARLPAEPATQAASGAGEAPGARPALGIDARSAIRIGIYAALIGAAIRGTDSAARH